MRMRSVTAVTAILVAGAAASMLLLARGHSGRPGGVAASSPAMALNQLPKIMLWAWERPEDLSFIDPRQIGVAFLAKTIYLNGDKVESRPRLQPLSVPDTTALVAVVRIESRPADRRSAAMAAASAPRTDKPAGPATRRSNEDSVSAPGDQNSNTQNFSDAQLGRIVDEISSVARMPRRISAIQIDFDARKSERGVYR